MTVNFLFIVLFGVWLFLVLFPGEQVECATAVPDGEKSPEGDPQVGSLGAEEEMTAGVKDYDEVSWWLVIFLWFLDIVIPLPLRFFFLLILKFFLWCICLLVLECLKSVLMSNP